MDPVSAVKVNLACDQNKCRSVSSKTLESKMSPGAKSPAPWDGCLALSRIPFHSCVVICDSDSRKY